MNYQKSVDANQREIVAALRKAGFQVITMHTVGAGFPDLIVCRLGKVWMLEVKTKTGRLTQAQRNFYERWRGPADMISVVRNVDEALQAVGVVAGDRGEAGGEVLEPGTGDHSGGERR